jgi:dienelactone hydrolase
VSPRSATFDTPFTVIVRGLLASTSVRISFSGPTAEGTARYQLTTRANANGEAALKDFYLYPHLHSDWPTDLTVSASSGHASASVHAERVIRVSSQVVTTDERPRGVGFYGEWIRPPHVRQHTALLLFGGSEGGLSQRTLAMILAAHGYPVLQLAYFAEPGIAQGLYDIPLEYFERALRWLAKQPETDPNRIVSFGASRGGEASLLIASMFPHLIHAAVGYVPSATINPSTAVGGAPAWTYHGKPVHGDRDTSTGTNYGSIPVERINGPVFVVGGDDDGLGASGLAVRTIKRRMFAHHRHEITALEYPKAGHAIGSAFPIQVDVSPVNYGVQNSRQGQEYFGGSPRADEAAREDSWPKLLAFLSRVGHADR